ncbi:MAG: helix-turn-helix transcriptional regulator [Spirochaetes bacterium]|nr:helix-turn-helix transcriptional regulator [Spirochaetota bacterium]
MDHTGKIDKKGGEIDSQEKRGSFRDEILGTLEPPWRWVSAVSAGDYRGKKLGRRYGGSPFFDVPYYKMSVDALRFSNPPVNSNAPVIHQISVIQGDITTVPATWHMEEPGSPFHRVYWMRGGVVHVSTPTERRTLRIGRLYLFPSHTPYRITQEAEHPLSCLWFELLITPDFNNPLIEIEPGSSSLLSHVIAALEAWVVSGGGNLEIATLLLMALVGAVNLQETLSSISDPRIEAVVKFLEQSQDFKCGVAKLARGAGLSTEHFSRRFKKATGASPKKYLIERRLALASAALRKGAIMREAAAAGGFPDEKEFSRLFKRYRGITPGDFRARNRGLI